MDARYLRVKKWPEHQHYNDRRPPWIKLKRGLIETERDFYEGLEEWEQWQLVRLWLYASGSESVMYVQDSKDMIREVPVIAYDERTLRMGIRSFKKIPLEKFIRLGWLEVVSEEEIAESFARFRPADVASTVASALASADASGGASTGARNDPPNFDVAPGQERESERGLEGAEVFSLGSTYLGTLDELVRYCVDGDERTPDVIRSFASKLPPAAFAQALAQVKRKRRQNNARYVVRTLSRMVEEGQYAA